MSKNGAGFTAERLPDNKERLTIVCENGMLDANKLNAFLLFLNTGCEPETLMGLQTLMFQAFDGDKLGDLTPEQLQGLESLIGLLTQLWACERMAAAEGETGR